MAQSIIVEGPQRRELARFGDQLAARDWLRRQRLSADICRRVPIQTERGWQWRTILLERFQAPKTADAR